MKAEETAIIKDHPASSPEVSIIVPAYNVASYLRECLDSVLAETYTDYELIIVDDGSTDDCGRIADDYARADRRVRVIHKENGGLSSARNAGLNIAEGKYVYFLDGDDRIRPGLLAAAVPPMRLGYDLVTFNYEVHGRPDGKHFEERTEYHLETMEDRYLFLRDCLFYDKFHWEVWNRIFSREIIETYHIRFENNKEIFAETCVSSCIIWLTRAGIWPFPMFSMNTGCGRTLCQMRGLARSCCLSLISWPAK